MQTVVESGIPFEASRALLKGPDMLPRFRVTGDGIPLSEARLKPRTQLIIFERGLTRRGLLLSQMGYRHVAQGRLAGEPYVIAFCAPCNIALGLTPVVNDRELHFSLGGVYNGMMLMVDDQTKTYWDYVNGRALHGALQGSSLETWGVEMASVEATRQREPDLPVYLCPSPTFGKLLEFAGRYLNRWLPPGFGRTMAELDRRRPKMELGFGVISDRSQKYYPLAAIDSEIHDRLAGRPLEVRLEGDGIPSAKWSDGTRPLQFLTRWYGFSYAFPRCTIYSRDSSTVEIH